MSEHKDDDLGLPPADDASAETLVIGGETIEVLPMRTAQIFQVLAKGKPVWTALRAQPVLQEGQAQEDRWLDLVVEHGPVIGSLCALAVRKPQAWIDELLPHEFLQLLFTVIRVNRDFFTREIQQRPALMQVLASLPVVEAGSTRLNS